MDTTKFIINKIEIPGLLEIDITTIEDARGWFQEKFQKKKLVAAGMPANFSPVQQNVSYNKDIGVTRGFHAEPWEKFISVICGKVYGVYVDLRAGANFGKTVAITVDSSKAVFVPLGVANSFQTLEPNTYYSYLVSAHWSPESSKQYKSLNLTEPELNIFWPISLDKAIISEKDQKNSRLKDVKPFEI